MNLLLGTETNRCEIDGLHHDGVCSGWIVSLISKATAQSGGSFGSLSEKGSDIRHEIMSRNVENAVSQVEDRSRMDRCSDGNVKTVFNQQEHHC